MPLEVAYAGVQPVQILHEMAQFNLNQVGVRPEVGVAEHAPNRIEKCHGGRWRSNPDSRLERVLDGFRKARVEFCEQRLAGQEHHRPVRGLARHDVAIPDVGNVLLDGRFKIPSGVPLFCRAASLEEGAETRDREFRIDRDGPRRVRQHDQAVNPIPVGEGSLERIRLRRKRLVYEVLELYFAEGAGGLFVGQQVLQFDDVRVELLDPPVSFADFTDPLAEPGQRPVRFAGLSAGRLVDCLPAKFEGLDERLDLAFRPVDRVPQRDQIAIGPPGPQQQADDQAKDADRRADQQLEPAHIDGRHSNFRCS